MKCDEAGKAFIKKEEGLRLEAYQDVFGYWSIGYGHRDARLATSRGISQSDADKLLSADLIDAECVISNNVKKVLNQNQFNALCSFVYNVGGTAFRNSTMLKLINQGKFVEAADQFPRWCYGHDKTGKAVINKGLLGRRLREKDLFCAP